MHEVVQVNAASDESASFDSASNGIPAELPPSASEGLRGDEELDQVFEKLTILYERLRPKLLRLVETRISPRLRGRIDAEGVLHNALLRLMKCLRFQRPASDDQLRVWIFKKVWSQLQDEIRTHKTDGRDVDKECPLPATRSRTSSDGWVYQRIWASRM